MKFVPAVQGKKRNKKSTKVASSTANSQKMIPPPLAPKHEK